MAERLKEKFLEEEKIVDLVVGPDAYRDIPNLLKEIEFGNDAVNVLLSKEETYADINPSRFNTNGINAFVSITRGCDNMCSFCVVLLLFVFFVFLCCVAHPPNHHPVFQATPGIQC